MEDKVTFCCGNDAKCKGGCDCQCHSLMTEIEMLRGRVEVAEAGYKAAVSKAEWQARTNAELNALHHEIQVLRRYGNKDCTAMADEALEQFHNAR